MKKDSEGGMSRDKGNPSGNQVEIYSSANVVELEERISRLEKVTQQLKREKFGK